jgi:flagellar hook-basal body complex protein FliE
MKVLDQVNAISSINMTDAINRAKEMTEKVAGGAVLGPRDEVLSFGDRMRDSLDSVARAQGDAAQLVKDYETGKETDLTKVMVAQQVSSLGFQMTLNVRNKALSAYRDIMNMPV